MTSSAAATTKSRGRIRIEPGAKRVRAYLAGDVVADTASPVDGMTIAESASPRLLFETGLPVRYYLPKTHVRMDLLTPTAIVSQCPYKGQAEWWSVRVGDRMQVDLAWSYRTPLPESQMIAGLIA